MKTQLMYSAFAAALATTALADIQPNFLFMIADDMGVDALTIYGQNPDTAVTPNLDRLARNGLVFEQFWSQPTCTPSRAEMLTGRYGFRTDVRRQIGGPTNGDRPRGRVKQPEGSPVHDRSGFPGPRMRQIVMQSEPAWGPTPDEFTLPQALKALDPGYATAAIGKWHMADQRNGWTEHPQIAGFDHYEGPFLGFPEGYYAWNKVTNGKWSVEEGYAVTAKIDDSIEWIEKQGDRPWFLWLAFNAPHTPFHKPPVDLINSPGLKALDPKADPGENPKAYFKALVEALDTEIGRLLASIDEDTLEHTVIVFVGDNGSDRTVLPDDISPEHAKGTLYNGGIHAPLILSGPGVPAGRVGAIAKTVDLYATVVDLAGGVAADLVPSGVALDAVSLAPYLDDPDSDPLRAFVYADFMPFNKVNDEGSYAIRDMRYKYMVHRGQPELYDLLADPYETNNLLTGELSVAEKAVLDRLKLELSALRDDL